MSEQDSRLAPVPKKSSLVEDVIQVLSQYILDGLIDGSIGAGDRLPSERELAERLQVGRSTLREATKVLIILGLLEVRVGQGTFIADGSSDFYAAPLAWGLIIGEQSISELIEARSLLDCEAAYLAAQRATEDELQDIRDAYSAMRIASESNELMLVTEADVRFHMAIAVAAHNTVIYQTIRTIRRLLEIWIRKVLVDRDAVKVTLAEHEKVYECLMARDPVGAQNAMRAHVEEAAKRLNNILTGTN